ncbi:tRNA (adenosine(37)-N6)-threonylcarbamoyltransferase complex dimerization subunit type 1 TsaB [Desulfonatronum sp. SC1]|uniref:tRNA (adenosine(37)-N6)-threonylcarbamoyltransferase complex dimerization subunit type 1 TsaB n=1 Tax=Desulfonatronum sp. SC1 TaxID=2109626 RepID=UPI000D321B1C|nr:tRNA (adenosine(37)-N6)-threonylcarbamoyltransferase complex dimerization subunit type 1 TsaB [Desulfonatronum sp. SC1]PTN38916.1 tRNA (adenosine(37)-N6)-threonylcarbamoyltransferase complex dimerization subunit type 1 TsaB [Desulfonatronum sp. SC1]
MTSIASSSDRSSTGSVITGSGEAPSRLLLTLNGVEDRVQIVLARGTTLVLHQEWAAPARVMRFLVPALEQALNLLGLKMHDLSGIACVRGPGNFTGLRLCLATTYGLAMGAGLPMGGLDYLPLLAAGPAPMLQGRLAVLTHARTRLVHAQSFQVSASPASREISTELRVTPLNDPRILAVDIPSDLHSLLGDDDQPLYLLGSGVRRNLEWIKAELPQARVLDPSWDAPQAHVLIQAAMNATFGLTPIEPLYLRPCDAEENLEFFAAKRGFTGREARDRIREETTGEVEERS